MIGALARLLRPLFAPLLKIDMSAPALPEGSSAVEQLKPSTDYLDCRYLLMGLACLGKLLAALVLSDLALRRMGLYATPILGCVALVLLGSVGALLVATRIDWETRHYVIGNRSIRLRQGVWVQREITLSFANVQNVEITQGPLARLYGFSSLRITTAGGGGKHDGGSHSAVLAGLTNAEAIRDLVMDLLRRQRDAGLGDAHDQQRGAPARHELLREIRDAARALHAAAAGARALE
jgi:uncharacterized membrane protein YdbT with pleckstrin-like domain